MTESHEELIPNFFRVAYAYKMIVEENMTKNKYLRDKYLSSTGNKITNQQVIILLRLSIVDKIKTSDLAISLNIALPNLVNQLQRLEELKLITRIRDEEDARVTFIQLSSHGYELIEDKPFTLDEQYSQYLMTAAERYSSIFATILQDLQSHYPDVYQAVYRYH